MKFNLAKSDFGHDFLFGAATAAYQIEGGQGPETGRGSCHWDTFAATRGNVVGLETGLTACDHYNRWPEDLDLLQAGGFDAYRFSFAWPRIMPTGKYGGKRNGKDALNQTGLDFYDRLIDGMLERGLKPFATAYHWDLPSVLADEGGWMNASVADRFADYCAVLAERYGDRLASIATINEPWCVAWLSHAMGVHAPGHRDLRAATRAMHHVLLAHGKGVQALRAHLSPGASPDVGLVLNYEKAEPAFDTNAARHAAATWHALYNQWYVGGAIQGRYPTMITEALAEFMPEGWQDDMSTIAQPLDFLGVNYYTRVRMAGLPDPGFPALESLPGPLDKTQLGWEVYPQGLTDILTWLQRDYTGDLPLYVTENGMAWADTVSGRDGAVQDQQRVDYFESHLRACLEAMAQGVPLKGYFAWSLLDNYEWAEGYGPRFGLVHVDYETQVRTPKASFGAFQAMLA